MDASLLLVAMFSQPPEFLTQRCKGIKRGEEKLSLSFFAFFASLR
jgi:hypothetical protein